MTSNVELSKSLNAFYRSVGVRMNAIEKDIYAIKQRLSDLEEAIE